jgi:hypothetical protein
MFSIMVFIVLASVELMAIVAINRLKGMGVFYDPSKVTQNYFDYLAHRDYELGWTSHTEVSGGIKKHTEHAALDGTRSDPLFSVTDLPCVSLFGDSFTWSGEVADGDAWGSLLAAKLKCRVANYGVGGYGTDQAYLRFRSVPPKGGIVYLNHLSENIARNVNQYRNLLYPGTEFSFKPRFVYRDNSIKLLPIPEIAPSNVGDFLKNPGRYLHNEYFLPGGAAGLQAIDFPYSVSLLKAIFWNIHIRARLANKPWYADFYIPNHPSESLDITDGIIRSFVAEAKSRGQIPIVTIIPTCRDLRYYKSRGIFPYDSLRTMISVEGIRYIDFGEEIAKKILASSPDELFNDCSGHFNETGYHYLAEIAFEYMRSDREIWSRLHN